MNLPAPTPCVLHRPEAGLGRRRGLRPPPDGRLLTIDVDDIDAVPFAVSAARCHVQARRLEPLGCDLAALFAADRRDCRPRTDTDGLWSERWTGLLADDTAAVTAHRLRGP